MNNKEISVEKMESSLDGFREEILARLDYLLKATDTREVFENIDKCVNETDNSLKECYKDFLFVIKMGIGFLKDTCNKYNVVYEEIDDLVRAYDFLVDCKGEMIREVDWENKKGVVLEKLKEMSQIIRNLNKKTKNERD